MLNILNNDGSKLWNFQTSRSNTGISTGIWTRRICNYFNVQKVDLSLYKVKTAKAFKLSLYTVDYIRNKNLTHRNWYTKLKMQIIVVYWHYHTEVPQINIISCDAQVSSLKWQSLTLRYKKNGIFTNCQENNTPKFSSLLSMWMPWTMVLQRRTGCTAQRRSSSN